MPEIESARRLQLNYNAQLRAMISPFLDRELQKA